MIWLDKECSSDDFTYKSTSEHSAVPTQLSTLCLKMNYGFRGKPLYLLDWPSLLGSMETQSFLPGHCFYVTDGLEAADPQPADGTGKLQLFQKLFWKSLAAQRSIVQELELPQPSKWCLWPLTVSR